MAFLNKNYIGKLFNMCMRLVIILTLFVIEYSEPVSTLPNKVEMNRPEILCIISGTRQYCLVCLSVFKLL